MAGNRDDPQEDTMANKDRGGAKVKKVAGKSLKEKRAIKKAKAGKTTGGSVSNG